jgi:hypothetical protein
MGLVVDADFGALRDAARLYVASVLMGHHVVKGGEVNSSFSLMSERGTLRLGLTNWIRNGTASRGYFRSLFFFGGRELRCCGGEVGDASEPYCLDRPCGCQCSVVPCKAVSFYFRRRGQGSYRAGCLWSYLERHGS